MGNRSESSPGAQGRRSNWPKLTNFVKQLPKLTKSLQTVTKIDHHCHWSRGWGQCVSLRVKIRVCQNTCVSLRVRFNMSLLRDVSVRVRRHVFGLRVVACQNTVASMCDGACRVGNLAFRVMTRTARILDCRERKLKAGDCEIDVPLEARVVSFFFSPRER